MRKGCTKSNILTMNHELVLENSSLAAAYSLPNTIIYLKAIKYLNIRLRQIYWTIKCQCCPHIETSKLICYADQLTGFYMRATLALNGFTNGPGA